MERKKLPMHNQRGQIIIVVILVMLVAAVIILAVAGRSVTDVKISTTNEDSSKAFSAAEAGVEAAVQQITAASPNLPAGIGTQQNLPPLANDATVNYTISLQGGTNKAFLSSSPINSDVETFQVYLAEKGSGNPNLESNNYQPKSICLYWGNADTSPGTPAIEASVIYRGGGVDKVARFAIDPVSRGNNFIAYTSGGDGTNCTKTIPENNNNLGVNRTFQYAYQLHLNGGTLPGLDNCGGGGACVKILRLRTLYSAATPQDVGVKPPDSSSENLPTQGLKISSSGQTASGTTRKVEVFQSYPALAGIFDFVLYNHTGDVTK